MEIGIIRHQIKVNMFFEKAVTSKAETESNEIHLIRLLNHTIVNFKLLYFYKWF